MEILRLEVILMKYQEIPTNLSGIYKINFPNGKIYIGRAKDIKTRIREHY